MDLERGWISTRVVVGARAGGGEADEAAAEAAAEVEGGKDSTVGVEEGGAEEHEVEDRIRCV